MLKLFTNLRMHVLCISLPRIPFFILPTLKHNFDFLDSNGNIYFSRKGLKCLNPFKVVESLSNH